MTELVYGIEFPTVAYSKSSPCYRLCHLNQARQCR